MPNLVGGDVGDMAQSVMAMPQQDDRPPFHNACDALEAGAGQHINRDYGNSPGPQITKNQVERYVATFWYHLLAPRESVVWRDANVEHIVGKAADDSGSNSECCVDRRSEPITIDVSNTAKLCVGVLLRR